MALESDLSSSHSLTTVNALFKTDFLEPSRNTYNDATVLLGRANRTSDFVGKKAEFPVPMGYSGGGAFGTPGDAGSAQYETVVLTRKKYYNNVKVDRESVKASLSNRGAWRNLMKEPAKKTVESGTRDLALFMYGDSTGSLGEIESVAGSNPGPFTLVIKATSTHGNWKNSAWEKNMTVNIEAGNTDKFKITSVTPASRTVVVQRASVGTSQVPVANDVVFLQNSENVAIQGLRGVLDATSGTLYGITVQRGWQASYQKDAAGATISHEFLNEGMSAIQEQTGVDPNIIVTSFKQFRILKDIEEDKKRYVLNPKSKSYTGNISFSGIEYAGGEKTIGIFPDRFCEDDRIYFLNDNEIEIKQAPDFGWFDDEGFGIWLRNNDDSDSYKARWGGYLEFFINPAFHGVLRGLG